MKKDTKKVGDAYEKVACQYLEAKGYKILLRNIYVGRDEIDIVARELDSGILVFVEVKGLKNFRNFSSEQNFSFNKKRKFTRACSLFAGRHNGLIGDSGYRLDLVAIAMKSSLLLDWRDDCDVRHYENVLA
ncbi:MAG: YraN family protein [bacterium]|nr:YraN family protein [bacterium]